MIIPCGIENKQVTSLEKELGHKVPLVDVNEKIKKHFEEHDDIAGVIIDLADIIRSAVHRPLARLAFQIGYRAAAPRNTAQPHAAVPPHVTAVVDYTCGLVGETIRRARTARPLCGS